MSSSYPIRAVAKLTGIPEDTLRAWERRYRAVTPRRSARGRLYSDKEIQRLLLLREAIDQGHSIGQIAIIADDQLRALLKKSAVFAREKTFGIGAKATLKQKPASDGDTSLGGVLAAIEAYDYTRAERELGRLATATPRPRDLVNRIAFPLMRTTGKRWHEGKFTIAQEHMITSLLSGLFASMLRLYAPTNPRAKVLMATPENEHHGFGILAAAMLTAAGGLGAIHLGTNLPTRDILHAARKTETNAILVGLRGAEPETAIRVLTEIHGKVIPRTRLWVGGASEKIAAVAPKLGWTVLRHFDDLELQLGFLGARF
jgi:DNA-binding transcriptional MerR regulator/methylmalonyl-CoA mutase cobalamin-binding subunit